MVIAVRVSSKNNPTAKELVYASLTPKVTVHSSNKKSATALRRTNFQWSWSWLPWVEKTQSLQLRAFQALFVRGCSSAIQVNLPVTYTKDCIPINRSHIPTCETAKQWSHQEELVDEIKPLKDCEVGLLIGYNCSRAMAPRRVILGGNEELYAIQTDLG